MVEVKKVEQVETTSVTIYCDMCGTKVKEYNGRKEYNYGCKVEAFSDSEGHNYPSDEFDLCYYCSLSLIKELKKRKLLKDIAEKI